MDRLTAWSTTQGGVSLTLLVPSCRCDGEDMKMCNNSVCVCVVSDPPPKPIDDTTADEFRDLLNLNLISYFLASKVKFPT